MDRDNVVVVEPEREHHVRTTRTEVVDGSAAHKEVRKAKTVWRTAHTVWFIIGIINTLLAFRFVFELLGANQASPFTQFIYALSRPFALPFMSIFGVTPVVNTFFDWSLLVAIAVYLLIGYGIIQLLKIIRPESSNQID